MAHDGIARGLPPYDKTSFIIRMRMYKGLLSGKMQISTLFKDDRWKIENGARCVYCGSTENLSVDHLFPRIKGGADNVENLVCSCKSCNSSKGKKDLMAWYNERGQFSSVMVLRRYLKLVHQQCLELGLMEKPISEVDGTHYHKTGSDQGRRDLMKDSVLAAIGLPLIRLSTAGSQEKEKIATALTRSIV